MFVCRRAVQSLGRRLRELVEAVLRRVRALVVGTGDGDEILHVLVKERKSEASFLARALAGASSFRRHDDDLWNRSLFGGQDLRASVKLHRGWQPPADKALQRLQDDVRDGVKMLVSCVALLVVASPIACYGGLTRQPRSSGWFGWVAARQAFCLVAASHQICQSLRWPVVCG